MILKKLLAWAKVKRRKDPKINYKKFVTICLNSQNMTIPCLLTFGYASFGCKSTTMIALNFTISVILTMLLNILFACLFVFEFVVKSWSACLRSVYIMICMRLSFLMCFILWCLAHVFLNICYGPIRLTLYYVCSVLTIYAKHI